MSKKNKNMNTWTEFKIIVLDLGSGKHIERNCWGDDTQKFYFKEAHNKGTKGDRSESSLGFYKYKYDQLDSHAILCFYSTSKNKAGRPYYDGVHYVLKKDVNDLKTTEKNNRYSFKIKDLQKHDLQNKFVISRVKP